MRDSLKLLTYVIYILFVYQRNFDRIQRHAAGVPVKMGKVCFVA
jgi:hypothetical protein